MRELIVGVSVHIDDMINEVFSSYRQRRCVTAHKDTQTHQGTHTYTIEVCYCSQRHIDTPGYTYIHHGGVLLLTKTHRNTRVHIHTSWRCVTAHKDTQTHQGKHTYTIEVYYCSQRQTDTPGYTYIHHGGVLLLTKTHRHTRVHIHTPLRCVTAHKDR